MVIILKNFVGAVMGAGVTAFIGYELSTIGKLRKENESLKKDKEYWVRQAVNALYEGGFEPGKGGSKNKEEEAQ